MVGASALNRAFGVAGRIAFIDDRRGGLVAELSSAGGIASVALKGGQLLSWLPAGQEEVLWLSPLARLDTPKAVRGGIPICWPWFGPHPTDASRPAHGIARTTTWSVVRAVAAEGETSVELALVSSGTECWPQQGELGLALGVTAGEQLTLDLITHNRGGERIEITQALHSYFRVSDVDNVLIEGLSGRDYLDTAAGGMRSHQTGAVAIDREVDRVYQGTRDEVVILDRGLGRKIRVSKEGSTSTVVWNPWSEKSARLGDMGTDGFRHMVCVETANAGEDVVSLPAGATHTLRAAIRVDVL